jgi:hypothetical protein
VLDEPQENCVLPPRNSWNIIPPPKKNTNNFAFKKIIKKLPVCILFVYEAVLVSAADEPKNGIAAAKASRDQAAREQNNEEQPAGRILNDPKRQAVKSVVCPSANPNHYSGRRMSDLEKDVHNTIHQHEKGAAHW